ncbi:hypothetical protein [Gryllotalpicola protaetiae]|uniref:hypothetical protein n=1 Tax=Gryllotalpicola protaetiae TaxID=2419771 RepID=UPI0013C435F4|nr:hypothetical protein [Gryllotalpicola protaetiae]
MTRLSHVSTSSGPSLDHACIDPSSGCPQKCRTESAGTSAARASPTTASASAPDTPSSW